MKAKTKELSFKDIDINNKNSTSDNSLLFISRIQSFNASDLLASNLKSFNRATFRVLNFSLVWFEPLVWY